MNNIESITKKQLTLEEVKNLTSEENISKIINLINQESYQIPKLTKEVQQACELLKQKDLKKMTKESMIQDLKYLYSEKMLKEVLESKYLINTLLNIQEMRIETKNFEFRANLEKGQFEELTQEEVNQLITEQDRLFIKAKSKWEKLVKDWEQSYEIQSLAMKITKALKNLLSQEEMMILQLELTKNPVLDQNQDLISEIEMNLIDKKEIALRLMEEISDKKYHDMEFITETEFQMLGELEFELDCSNQTKRGMLLNKIKEELYQTTIPSHHYLKMMRAAGEKNYLATIKKYLEESIPLENLPEEFKIQLKMILAQMTSSRWANMKLKQLENENPVLIVNMIKNNSLKKYLEEIEAAGKRMFNEMIEFEMRREECPDMNKDPVAWDRFYNMSILLVEQRIRGLI